MPSDLWSFVKQFASKEITKISIPVNYCEPLSMLQRMTEDFEYSFVLDNAAELEDPEEQLAHVAAFTVSAYAGSTYRTGKPFNPLLNETFEIDRRDDLGWRLISEQVGHHPPRSALHIEGARWKCWQDYGITMKYRGNYVQAKPDGISHLIFDSGNHYTWNKTIVKVNNVIIGRLWVDLSGVSEVKSHSYGSECVLTYEASSVQQAKKKVSGTVVNSEGVKKWTVRGQWDKSMSATPFIADDQDAELPGTAVIWYRPEQPLNSEVYYHFGVYAAQLNEPEQGVAPTDSRNRTDVRLLENGSWQEANRMKNVLEDKQRERLKYIEGEPEPIWFKKERDTRAGRDIYVYKGEYWECKTAGEWSRCPDIFPRT